MDAKFRQKAAEYVSGTKEMTHDILTWKSIREETVETMNTLVSSKLLVCLIDCVSTCFALERFCCLAYYEPGRIVVTLFTWPAYGQDARMISEGYYDVVSGNQVAPVLGVVPSVAGSSICPCCDMHLSLNTQTGMSHAIQPSSNGASPASTGRTVVLCREDDEDNIRRTSITKMNISYFIFYASCSVYLLFQLCDGQTTARNSVVEWTEGTIPRCCYWPRR